jgi:hypothetical protein
MLRILPMKFATKKKWFAAMATQLAVRGARASVRLHRATMLVDSMDAVMALSPPQLQGKFAVVYEGESGVDAGGLLTDWLNIVIASL